MKQAVHAAPCRKACGFAHAASIRASALVLACACLFSACTSVQKPPSSVPIAAASLPASAEPAATPGNFSIAYAPQDGFNPYLSQSNLTMQMGDLLFDHMVDITPQMTLQYKCVSAVQTSGLTAVLTPDETYRFTDGTPVSAEDIAACIEAARVSANYAGQLAGVEKAEVQGSNVLVTLKAPDSLFAYLLNLPVMKAEDVQSRQPRASGRYTYGSETVLLKNDTHKEVSLTAPNEIHLIPCKGFDEIINALSTGGVSLYATELENNAASSTTSLQNFYKMNSLVYLGLNGLLGEQHVLASAAGRRAVGSIVDRSILAEKCYFSRAYPATGALNPSYPCVNLQQTLPATADTAVAEQLMTGLGYKKNMLDGYYEKAGKRLELRLLVYSGSTNKRYLANVLSEHLQQNGFYINVEETDNFDIYTQKITAGDFDMYIGEVKLYNNMDLAPFLPAGAAASGMVQSEALLAAYAAMRENITHVPAYEAAFAAELPYVPLVWRCGTLVTAKNVHGIVPTVSNTFYNIDNLICKGE